MGLRFTIKKTLLDDPTDYAYLMRSADVNAFIPWLGEPCRVLDKRWDGQSVCVEFERMVAPERWVDATTFLDAANGIRREVSNLGGNRVVDVRGSEEALTPEQCAALGIAGRELIAQGVIDTVEEARAVGEAMLADLKGVQADDVERAAYEYVVGHNAIPAVAGEDLFPGDVVTMRDGKAYRVNHMMGGGVSQFFVSKGKAFTIDPCLPGSHRMTPEDKTCQTCGRDAQWCRVQSCSHKGGYLDRSKRVCRGCHATFAELAGMGIDTREPVKNPCPAVGGGPCDMGNPKRCCSNCGRSMEEQARLDSGMLRRLGDRQFGGGCNEPCEQNFERAGGSDKEMLVAVKMANLDATHPKPFVHPRSLKGNVNVAPLAVDDPVGDDVSE